jgi:anti-anti-sigma factor
MDGPTLQLSVVHGPPPIIHAVGELNYTNCDRLAALIIEAERGSDSVVELGLSGLEFVDSSGLRVLLIAARDAAKHGAVLRIVSLNRQFRHILDLSGFVHLFEIAVPPAEAPVARVCLPVESPYSFQVQCSGEACHNARSAVRRFAEGMGFDQVSLDDITLAVGEAVSNAMRHGSNHGGSVDLECKADDCHLTLVLRYRSDVFDPDALPIPDLDSAPSGGMGVYFMKLVMDRVHYEFDNGYAVLTLEKQMGD